MFGQKEKNRVNRPRVHVHEQLKKIPVHSFLSVAILALFIPRVNILENIPQPMSFWVKNMKRRREKRGKCKTKRRKGERKRRKKRENKN
jgi:hypothetical protein